MFLLNKAYFKSAKEKLKSHRFLKKRFIKQESNEYMTYDDKLKFDFLYKAGLKTKADC